MNGEEEGEEEKQQGKGRLPVVFEFELPFVGVISGLRRKKRFFYF